MLEVSAVDGTAGWQPASGRVRLSVEGRLDDLHCGDVVEVTGRLTRPEGPHNPGERDFRSFLLDRRITAALHVKRSADPVVRLEEGWRASLFGWLAAIRGWGARALERALPDESDLATALLLGDSTALDREEWDAYVRTGVIHVLAISGQHLVVLGWFLWVVFRLCGVRRRHAAWAVALFLLAYALMTGARPSAVRSAVMVCVVCGGIILRRPVIPANTFAFAWLIVIGVNPTDPFTAGCQLSFLSVFVLIWGCSRWLRPRELTPVEQLIEETRGVPEKMLRALLRALWQAFAISTILTVVNAPLVLAWQNVASPIAVLLGPPLVVLTSIALVDRLPGADRLAAGDVACVAVRSRYRVVSRGVRVARSPRRPRARRARLRARAFDVVARRFLPARRGGRAVRRQVGEEGRSRRSACGCCSGWSLGLQPRTSDEARITFLAVGHGGCVVIEAPDGRVLLYDTGTTAGPDAMRRVVAPYLWSRGISRVDEVFLSHADLDHFNGVPELLRRFHVARVTMTPTFSDKESPGVEAVLAALERHGVSRRTVVAGQRFNAGDVTFDVLHPPPVGPREGTRTRGAWCWRCGTRGTRSCSPATWKGKGSRW